jgi:hypothetical protein
MIKLLIKATLIKSGILETCAAFPSEAGDIQGGACPLVQLFLNKSLTDHAHLLEGGRLQGLATSRSKAFEVTPEDRGTARASVRPGHPGLTRRRVHRNDLAVNALEDVPLTVEGLSRWRE